MAEFFVLNTRPFAKASLMITVFQAEANALNGVCRLFKNISHLITIK
jgi:hypothetical protein